MKYLFLILLLIILILPRSSAAGDCVIDPLYSQDYPAHFAAGCFITTPEGVILARNRLDELQLFIGENEKGESAQCTASRETKEELGLDVTVGKLLHSFKTKNGSVYLFHCTIDPNTDLAKVEPLDKFEVKEIIVLDPKTMKNQHGEVEKKWRF